MRRFGLDISDSVIRLAVIERHGKSFRLPVRGEIPLSEGAVIDGTIMKPTEVTELLKKLVTAARPKSHQAIVTLPERHSFVKVITLPAGSEASEAGVKAAVLPHLPYTWEEMSYDWRLLPPIPGQAGTRIMFGSAPLSIVKSYLDVLHNAGIEAVSMEIESVAIARAMIPPNAQGAHIILDLGRTRTSLILVSDGVVEFSTTIRYAGKELNQYIADALHLTLEQAQRAKELFGLDPTKGKGLLANVLAPQLDVLAEKIESIQEYYRSRFPTEAPISSILLTGSGALIRHLDLELSKRLHEPVTPQPAWIIRRVSDDPTDIHDIGYTYTTALGLALQPFFSPQ